MYSRMINIHPFTLHAATSAPTIASIREETVKRINITLEEPAEGSECVEDYIIQYEGRSVSTCGALSVVIEDVVFCSVAPVTFNVSAVLRDGSLIDGSESDFTLTGESKYSSILWFQVLLLHKSGFLSATMSYTRRYNVSTLFLTSTPEGASGSTIAFQEMTHVCNSKTTTP